MKARIAAIAVIGLLTLSVIAIGVSAGGQVQGDAPTATASVENQDDYAVESAFKMVCPFH